MPGRSLDGGLHDRAVREVAGRRWEDLVEDLEVPGSPLARFVDVKRGKGDQRCAFPNASKISPFPPVEDGLHGETPPLVGIDHKKLVAVLLEHVAHLWNLAAFGN